MKEEREKQKCTSEWIGNRRKYKIDFAVDMEVGKRNRQAHRKTKIKERRKLTKKWREVKFNTTQHKKINIVHSML